MAEKKEDEVSQPTISDPDVHALEETLPTTVPTALPEEEKQQPEVGYSLQILKHPLLKLDFNERHNLKTTFNFFSYYFFSCDLE